MICCRLQDGPCDGIDYHFVAADEPPSELVMGRLRDDEAWYRLGLKSLVVDPDFHPQRYVLMGATPVALDDDGEPVFAYTHDGP